MNIKYFVAYYGKQHKAWSGNRFVPAEQKLNIQFLSEEGAKITVQRLRRMFPKIAEDIYVDSCIA